MSEPIPPKKSATINNFSQQERNYYLEHSKKWESSNLKQAKYCKLNNLHYNTFSYLRSKFICSKKNTTPNIEKKKFIPIKSPEVKKEPSSTCNRGDIITVRLPKGSVIEFPVSIGTEQVSAIFTSLGAVL